MPSEEYKKFASLLNQAKLRGGMRWCTTDGTYRQIQDLDTIECWNCKLNIINGGECDPI